MSIEIIELDHFSTLPFTEINSSTKPYPQHAVFNCFLPDDKKQDVTPTTAHSKFLIKLLK